MPPQLDFCLSFVRVGLDIQSHEATYATQIEVPRMQKERIIAVDKEKLYSSPTELIGGVGLTYDQLCARGMQICRSPTTSRMSIVHDAPRVTDIEVSGNESGCC